MFGRFFYTYLGLKTHKFPSKKKKKNFVNVSTGAHRTLVPKFQDLTSPKMAWTFGLFVRKTCVFSVVALLSFDVGSIFGGLHNLILVLRSQIFECFCAKRFVGVLWGTWNRLHKEKHEKKGIFTTETPGHRRPFEGLWSVVAHFSRKRQS